MPDETNPDSADTVTVAPKPKKAEPPDPTKTIAAKCVKKGIHVNDVPQDQDLTVAWVKARIRTKERGAALLGTGIYEATEHWPRLPAHRPAR